MGRPVHSICSPERLALAIALAFALASLTADAAPAGDPLAVLERTPGAADPVRSQALFLDLVMDGRVVRPLVEVRLDGERVWLAREDLQAIGLVLPADLAADAEGRVALDSRSWLQFRYDPAQQQLVLSPRMDQRVATELGYRLPPAVQVDRHFGLVLDWDAYARHLDDEGSVSVGTRLRTFGPFGTFEHTGVSRAGQGDEGYRRLDTSWSYSDPGRLWTWTVGDFVTGGLAWSHPVRMAGVQWRRNFGVRPDLLTFPVPRFSSSAAVPSSVELYVNNMRQYEAEVEPGPFVLTEFPRVLGAGEAVVVVTDALGRRTETRVPLYVDYQRLAMGLSDFSLEAGVLRYGFGTPDDEYGGHAVGSASVRHGLSDRFTLEAHGEGGPDLYQLGTGLAWSPGGRFGVVTASWSHSNGLGDHGIQRSVGYQYATQRGGIDLYTQRANGGYRDLASLESAGAVLRAQDRASAWVTIPHGGLTASWLRYRDGAGLDSRSVSLGATQTHGRVSASANLFHDNRAGHGASVSVSIALGDHGFASAAATHRDDRDEAVVSYRRSAPYAGGWGWSSRIADGGDGQLAAEYRGRRAEWLFGIDRVAGLSGGFAQGTGSVALMDRRMYASRRIHDAFAVVSSNGIAGVPVLFENRVAGVTDRGGFLLLSDLRGWQRNRIGIDPDLLPPDLELAQVERLVTPAGQAGVRVEFPLQALRSASVRLLGGDGRPVTAGTRVRRADGTNAIVGFDGELWLEHYQADEALQWSAAGGECRARTPATTGDAPGLPVVACEKGEAR